MVTALVLLTVPAFVAADVTFTDWTPVGSAPPDISFTEGSSVGTNHDILFFNVTTTAAINETIKVQATVTGDSTSSLQATISGLLKLSSGSVFLDVDAGGNKIFNNNQFNAGGGDSSPGIPQPVTPGTTLVTVTLHVNGATSSTPYTLTFAPGPGG
jgi:hypothetical protein